MKKSIKISTLILSIALFIGSCSMEKRQHLAGYHIEWKHKKSDPIAKNSKKEKEIATEETFVASENSNSKTSVENYIVLPTTSDIIEAKLQEVNNAKLLLASNKKAYQAKSKIAHLPFKKVAVLKAAKKINKSSGEGISKGVYILLAILIPFVAVGLATDWGIETLWNVLWCLLCGIPGIIHAFIILKRKGII